MHFRIQSLDVYADCEQGLVFLSLLSVSTHPDVEVSVVIAGADAECVVGPRGDTGGLNLEDVRGDGALRGDAHVAVDDGERQISTGRLVDRTHTTATRTQTRVNRQGTLRKAHRSGESETTGTDNTSLYPPSQKTFRLKHS